MRLRTGSYRLYSTRPRHPRAVFATRSRYAGEGPFREADSSAELEARQRMDPEQWEVYIGRRYQVVLRWRAEPAAKSRRAARYPWLPAAPDPPEP